MLSLDIGCGSNPRGSINVDVRPNSHADIVCHALHLPFKEGSFDKIFCSHVIEHFSYADARRLLGEVHRGLKEHGVVEIWTPNFQGLGTLKAWLLGASNIEPVPPELALLVGEQTYRENVHMSLWTADLLRSYSRVSGFRDFKVRGLSTLPLLSKIAPTRCGNLHLTAVKA